MTWRLYTRGKDGNEEVAFSANQQESVAAAREMLVRGHVLIRIESDEGEILEGKQLQEAVTMQHDRSKAH